jgi:hypothetical protein
MTTYALSEILSVYLQIRAECLKNFGSVVMNANEVEYTHYSRWHIGFLVLPRERIQ